MSLPFCLLQIIAGKLFYFAQEHGISEANSTVLFGTLNAGGLTATANVTGIIRCACNGYQSDFFLLFLLA